VYLISACQQSATAMPTSAVPTSVYLISACQQSATCHHTQRLYPWSVSDLSLPAIRNATAAAVLMAVSVSDLSLPAIRNGRWHPRAGCGVYLISACQQSATWSGSCNWRRTVYLISACQQSATQRVIDSSGSKVYLISACQQSATT